MSVEEKRVLVTGGAGSIGAGIVKECLRQNAKEVIVLDIAETELFMLRKTIGDERLTCWVADIRNAQSLERIFHSIDEVDVLFHCAALKHVTMCEENPFEAVLTNVVGTQNVIDVAVKFGIDASILISTDKAVNPICVMGATKFLAEKMFIHANQSSRRFWVVRFGNVVNSKGSVIPVFVKSIREKNQITITNPNVTRFIMRIEEAAGLALKSLDVAVGGEIFVLEMSAFRLGDLAEVFALDTSAKVKVTSLMEGEKLHESLFSEHELGRVVDVGEFYAIVDSPIGHSKTNVVVSSNKAPKLTHDELRRIIYEYIEQI